MELKLSCYRCGGFEFEQRVMEVTEIEGKEYLHKENELKDVVECKNCGLTDYIANLVVRMFG